QPICESDDRFWPGEPVPVEGCGLAGNKPRGLLPVLPLQCVSALCRGQVKRGLERGLQSGCCAQPPQRRGGFGVLALLEIPIDQILHRMRELVPNEFSVVTRRIRQSGWNKVIAIPQCAIAHPGSAVAIRSNASRACG